jgi:hypothetical protein
LRPEFPNLGDGTVKPFTAETALLQANDVFLSFFAMYEGEKYLF